MYQKHVRSKSTDHSSLSSLVGLGDMRLALVGFMEFAFSICRAAGVGEECAAR
jgi:hypothetical protein